jgi:hypothetical protein
MKTAVEFMASELLYLDNEYNMKLINKNEYQAKRKEIIEQAKEMEKEQRECICVNVIDRILGESEQGKEINSKQIFEDVYKETFKSEYNE